jgi:hypothetical protein
VTTPPARRRNLDKESGITSLEVAVLLPLVLIVIMTAVQTALWFFAREGALAAARAGARQGAAYNSSASVGAAGAKQFANQQVGDFLTGVGASPAGSSGTETRITVTGNAISLVPGLPIYVSETAELPNEVFTK